MGISLNKLDRLAAEHILGWSQRTIEYVNDGIRDGKRWQPTRNISQAWECLEQVGVFTLALKTYHDGSEYAYHVILPGNITVTSTSAPEAIVRACLRARGVEI